MMCGGGGAGIDLTVVGGTTQPTSPEKNTIWVNTSTTIGNIYLQATEPTSPAEGDIWVMTGTKFAAGVTDVVQMNVCDEPSTIISLVAVKQYISGAWVVQSDAFYDGSAWHDSTALLFSNGTFGGYTATYGESMARLSSTAGITRSSAAPSITTSGNKNEIKLSFTYSSKKYYDDLVVFWDIDLSEYTSMIFTPWTSHEGENKDYCMLAAIMDGTLSSISSYTVVNNAVRSVASPMQSEAKYVNYTPVEVDISDLAGVYHLAFKASGSAGSSGNTNYLYEVELKRG